MLEFIPEMNSIFILKSGLIFKKLMSAAYFFVFSHSCDKILYGLQVYRLCETFADNGCTRFLNEF